jgi:hypothetical protein
MKVLVACEYSGVVREAFKKRGHDAMSCDLLPTDIPGKHYQGNVYDVMFEKWDLIIAHPPCTYLSNSGVCWLHKDKSRWAKMEEGAEFFKGLLNLPDCHRICVENPIQHKYAREIIETPYTQIIQPWMFGHMECKATCLWLKGLPPLVSTKFVKLEMMRLPKNKQQRLHYLPPSKDRWKERSRTFQGIADAMAEQWSNLEELK